MEPEDSPEGNASSMGQTISAVTDLVKAVPIYEDAVQPVAKEAGKALQTVGRAVNAALLPVKGLVWGVEQIEAFVHARVSKKLEKVPVENICPPDPAVAGPALESLRYTGHKPALSEMYANLLASSMDKETAKTAHPGFVEIIRNMSSDEAKVLEHLIRHQVAPVIDINRKLANRGGTTAVHELVSTLGIDAKCEHPELASSYLINLERLGLIEIHRDGHLTREDAYENLINDAGVKNAVETLNKHGGEKFQGDIKKYYVRISVFGRQFGNACVVSRET